MVKHNCWTNPVEISNKPLQAIKKRGTKKNKKKTTIQCVKKKLSLLRSAPDKFWRKNYSNSVLLIQKNKTCKWPQ